MVDCTIDGVASMHAIRRWCALHKSEKHSDSDCRAQQESATSITSTAKKRPKGLDKKKTNKPRRLKFKSTKDKKKFLCSIEDTEGVSLESASSEDKDVVEQSLMQLDAVSSSDVLEEAEEEDSDPHILMINPDPLLTDDDVVMESVLSRSITESSFNPYGSNISTEELDSVVNSIRLGGEKRDSPAPGVDSPMPSKADFASLSPSDAALLESPMHPPTASIPPFKEEKNPFSPEQYPDLDEEMYPALLSPQGSVPAAPIALPNRILVGGVYYERVPPLHNVVVAQSSILMPPLVPVNTPVNTPEDPLTFTPNGAITVETKGDPITIANPPATGNQESPAVSCSSAEVTAPKEGPEFTQWQAPLPANQPSKVPKNGRRERPRSWSSSSHRSDSRQRDEARASIPRGVIVPEAPSTLKRVRGIGRGKAKEAKAPLLAPTSLLSGTTKPKEGLRIPIFADSDKRIVERVSYPANIEHLAGLEGEASSRWELTAPTSIQPDLVVNLPPTNDQEDSDVDLCTGESRNPSPWGEPLRFSYSS